MKQVGCHHISVGSEVIYRGEGNANLVIALPDRRIVLRFPKSKFADKSQDEKLQTIARYVNNVMIPKFGENYVHPVSIGVVSYQDLETIKEAVKFIRPDQRCYKDIFFPKALILPDLTLPSPDMDSCTRGVVISVELKPKQGYYFPSNCVHDTLCNFCLKQWYKLQTGRIPSRSEYCPLDLYSGDPVKMSKAILALMRSPQNNLRIFSNGQLLHGEDDISDDCRNVLAQVLGCQDDSQFADILVSTLLSDTQSQITTASRVGNRAGSNIGGHVEKVCDSKMRTLPNKCILNAVLNIQKQTAITDKEALNILNELLNMTDDITDLQRLVTGGKDLYVLGAQRDKIMALRNYMLAVTAKDLSMILTIREAKPGVDCQYRNKLNSRNKMFCYSWSLVDLDPKQLQRISKYVSQKQLWLDAFNKRKK